MRLSSHAGAGPRRMASHQGGGAWPGGVGGLPPGPLGGALSPFGDGSYSGNVIQGGSVLVPQDGYSSTSANGASFASGDGNTWLELALTLANGATITHLGSYHTTAGVSQSLLIFRYDGASATPVARVDISTVGNGWDYYALPAPYVVPATGTYFIGLHSDTSSWWSAGNYSNSYYIGGAAKTIGTAYSYNGPGTNAHMAIGYRREVAPAGTPCIVVTGAATIVPDLVTFSCTVMCDQLIVDGAGASLSATTNNKGLIVYAKSGIQCLNGGRIHNDKLGKAGNFGNLTAWALTPASLQRKLKQTALETYVVLGEGAAGAGANTSVGSGLSGAAASAMQTGGGGSGVTELPNPPPGGKGGKGGPCCGGAGGGAHSYMATGFIGIDAGDYGGPGGNASTGGNGGTGGAGNPVGLGADGGVNGEGAGGGLLMLFTPSFVNNAGCAVSADGARAGATAPYFYYGGSAGGGIVCIVTRSGGYSNLGTVRAFGGAGISGAYSGGPGGVGSVNILTA